MGTESSSYRWWCVTCSQRHPRDVTHRRALGGASDHAAQHGGHTVFVTHNGMSTLDVFWFPPHARPRLIGDL